MKHRWWGLRSRLAKWIAPCAVYLNKDSRFVGASHWGNLEVVWVDNSEVEE